MAIPGFFVGTGMPDGGWWEALWPDPDKVLSETGMRSGDKVLDLCCGDGWFTVPISKAAKHVTAVDIDPVLLERARVRLSERDLTNCTLVQSDAYEVAKRLPEPVDYVLLANAFHGVPDRVKLASVVRDVIRPGGLFAVVSWHQQPREQTTILGEPRGPATDLRMTPEQTIVPVVEAGLIHKFTIPTSPYHYGAVFERPAT